MIKSIVGPVRCVKGEIAGRVGGAPHHEPGPLVAGFHAFLRVRYISAFADGHQLLSLGQVDKSLILALLGVCVRFIYVHSNNVHILIPRIPVKILVLSTSGHIHSPHPDEVVQTVHIHQLVIKKPPELLARLCAMSSPPEPCSVRSIKVIVARRFVERTPYHRNILILKKLEVSGNFLYILHYEIMLPCAFLHCLSDVEGGLVAIEGITVEIIVIHSPVPVGLAVRHIPVPHIVHQTVRSPLLLRS